MNNRAIGIIPARYGATRLPGKMLLPVAGKPLIQHVYKAAAGAGSLDRVLVATDDRRIADAVTGFGGDAVITSPEHQSGSDRLAEAAALLDYGIIVNIQGDEPFIRGDAIDSAVEELRKDAALESSTLATGLNDPGELLNPNVVKVVTDLEGNALYFSRAPIPHLREGRGEEGAFLKHIGLYAYRKPLLLLFTKWPQTPLERCEKLEQMRILEHGVKMRVVKTPHDSVSVDTPGDLEQVRKMLVTRDS